MKVVWKLVEACIIPILTYAGETRNPNKTENRAINNILECIIKRILMVPRTTPREALYIETGIMDVEHTVMKNRINMEKRLSLNKENITYKVKENGGEKGWKYITNQIKNRIKIDDMEMEGSRTQVKNKVSEKVKEAFRKQIEDSGADKSKIKYLMDTKNYQWEPGKPAPYIMQLTRQQASAIFKAKTRMLQIKENYKGKYQKSPNKLKCRACKKEDETQQHILNECEIIHTDNALKVQKDDLKSEKPEELRKTSFRVMEIMKKLETIHQGGE